MDRLLHKVQQLLRILAATGIAAIMLAVTADVLWRSTVGAPLPGVQDYSALALVILVYLSLAATQRDGGHVYFELIDRWLRPRIRHAVTILGFAAVLAVIGLLVMATGQEALTSFQTSEYRIGLARAPVWPARFALPIGLAVLWLQLLSDLAKHVAQLRRCWA